VFSFGGRNSDRASSVAKRVRDQVGDDAIERIRIGLHEEFGIDANLDLVGTLAGHSAHDLVGSFAYS
jgi:hypothetical protein